MECLVAGSTGREFADLEGGKRAYQAVVQHFKGTVLASVRYPDDVGVELLVIIVVLDQATRAASLLDGVARDGTQGTYSYNTYAEAKNGMIARSLL